MRKLLVLLLATLAIGAHAQEFEVMTFNIRYDNPNDGEDQWAERKADVVNLINYYAPSVLGVQEAVYGQMQYLDSALSNHSYIGVGRDDGKQAGEYSAIFYDSAKLELLDKGTFWLSTTPEQVSTGWDAALPRVCTYGLFREKSSEKVFWVFNTHFDHIGAMARVSSAALIVKKVNELNIGNAPVILMGDLNSTPEDNPIKLLNNHFEDARHVKNAYGPEGTFFGFNPNELAIRRIDYLFGKNISFKSYRTIDDRRDNNRHVSDHLPVLAKVSLSN